MCPPDCPHRPFWGSRHPPGPLALIALPAMGSGGGGGDGTFAAPPECPGEPLPEGILLLEPVVKGWVGTEPLGMCGAGGRVFGRLFWRLSCVVTRGVTKFPLF